jgi:hypothetical protein
MRRCGRRGGRESPLETFHRVEGKKVLSTPSRDDKNNQYVKIQIRVVARATFQTDESEICFSPSPGRLQQHTIDPITPRWRKVAAEKVFGVKRVKVARLPRLICSREMAKRIGERGAMKHRKCHRETHFG